MPYEKAVVYSFWPVVTQCFVAEAGALQLTLMTHECCDPGSLRTTCKQLHIMWEVFLYMCCFYWLVNKESALTCDRAE